MMTHSRWKSSTVTRSGRRRSSGPSGSSPATRGGVDPEIERRSRPNHSSQLIRPIPTPCPSRDRRFWELLRGSFFRDPGEIPTGGGGTILGRRESLHRPEPEPTRARSIALPHQPFPPGRSLSSHSIPARRTGKSQTEHHHQAQPPETFRRTSVVVPGSQPQRGQSSSGTMRSRRGWEQDRERARSTNRPESVFQFTSSSPRDRRSFPRQVNRLRREDPGPEQHPADKPEQHPEGDRSHHGPLK